MSSVPRIRPDDDPPATADLRFYPGGFDAIRPIPFDVFRARLLALYEPPMRSHRTMKKMGQVLDQLGALGVATTADLTTDLVARWIAARPGPENPTTTLGYLAYLRAACALAAAEGWVRVSPFTVRKTWLRRVEPTGRRHHSADEIARVLALLAADVTDRFGWAQWRARRLQALAAVFIFTGVRRDEGLYLCVEDLDLEGRMIAIRPRVGNRLKTEASAAPVPIPDTLAVVLNDWMTHRLDAPVRAADVPDSRAAYPRDMGCPWLFPNTRTPTPWTGGPTGAKPLDKLKAAGARAGVEGLTFQSLRHSWATHAESLWGLSPATIQRVLRHTTQRTQAHYRHADLPNLRAAVRGIGFGPAPDGPTPTP